MEFFEKKALRRSPSGTDAFELTSTAEKEGAKRDDEAPSRFRLLVRHLLRSPPETWSERLRALPGRQRPLVQIALLQELGPERVQKLWRQAFDASCVPWVPTRFSPPAAVDPFLRARAEYDLGRARHLAGRLQTFAAHRRWDEAEQLLGLDRRVVQAGLHLLAPAERAVLQPRRTPSTLAGETLHASGTMEAASLDPETPELAALTKSAGQALPSAVADKMAELLGHSFAHVRIHTDGAAAQAAAYLQAHAFTLGADIYFAEGAFTPSSLEGEKLLLHELTHVVQHDQGRLPPRRGDYLEVSSPTDASEREARAAEQRPRELGPPRTLGADRAPSGPALQSPQPTQGTIQRQHAEGSPASSHSDTTTAAFHELDGWVRAQIDAVAAGVDRLPPKLLTATYSRAMQTQSLAVLRKMASDAQLLVEAATKSPDETKQMTYLRAAGARYQSALVIAQVLQLEVNLVLVGSFAEEAGTPSKMIEDNLQIFDAQMQPLVAAACNVDRAQMAAALKAALPAFRETSALLDRAVGDIGRNAQLSQKVIAVADLLLLALSLYQVWKTPAVPGEAAHGGPSQGPQLVKVFAGGTAAMAPGVTLAAVAEAVKALKQLVAIGALDPGLIASLGAMGGSRTAPIPQLGQPALIDDGKSFAKPIQGLGGTVQEITNEELHEQAQREKKDIRDAMPKQKLPEPGKRVRSPLAQYIPPPGELFQEWFDSLSVKQFEELWADESTETTIGARDIISTNIRNPGKLHEWLQVAEARRLKEWNVSMRVIQDARTLTSETFGKNFRHGGAGSGAFHNETRELIQKASNFSHFKRLLNEWADREYFGRNRLPTSLQEK